MWALPRIGSILALSLVGVSQAQILNVVTSSGPAIGESSSEADVSMASDLRNNTDPTLMLGEQLRDYALFLDVDGTLLPIADRPHEVRVPPDLLDVLDRLQQELLGAVALVSGRAIPNLDDLFAPLLLPSAGVHGLERRGHGAAYSSSANREALNELRPALSAFVERHPGLLLEDKELSLTLHCRLVPELKAQVQSFLTTVMAGSDPSLELTRGKMVFEVKPRGVDKGTAIQCFMSEAPFRGRRPIFMGDDTTDEDGFVVVNQMKGISLRVGPKQATAAEYSLPNETAVHAWLKTFIANLEHA